MDSKCLQLNYVEKQVSSFVGRYRHQFININIDHMPLRDVSRTLKTAGNSKEAKKILNIVEQNKANNNEERAVKNIHRHILKHIIFKSHTLSNQYIKSCTELSMLIKTWSYIFEEYFGYIYIYNGQMFIQWGDSVSPACKLLKLDMRLDLRIITTIDEDQFDVMTGEAAKTSAITFKKYYDDKLKSVLATKRHLNQFIESLSNWSKKEILKIKFPIIQLMGSTCHISSLQIIDKGVYVLNDIYYFLYPKTIKQLKSGAIDDLIKGLVILEVCNRKQPWIIPEIYEILNLTLLIFIRL